MIDTSSVDIGEGWTLQKKPQRRENKKSQNPNVKQEVRRLNGEYELSTKIKDNKCIHCMVEKCREEQHKNNNECPSIVSQCITEPKNTIPGLSHYLTKENLISELSKFEIKYTVCLFNHCRNRCRNLNDGRCNHIELENGEKLHYCYTDISGKNKIIYVSVHVDLLIREDAETGNPQILWKPLHNPLLDDVSVSSVKTTNTNQSNMTKSTEKTFLSTLLKSPNVTTSNHLEAVDVSKSGLNVETESSETSSIMLSTIDVQDLMKSPMTSSKSHYSNRTSNSYYQQNQTSQQMTEMMKMMFGMNEEVQQLKEFIRNQNDYMRKLVDENTKLSDSVLCLNIRIDKLQKENGEKQTSQLTSQQQQQQQNRDVQAIFRRMNNIQTQKITSTSNSDYVVLNN